MHRPIVGGPAKGGRSSTRSGRTARGRKQAQYQKSQRREGQLEIGVQETCKRRPDLSDDALLELAKEVHGLSRDNY